ncbi:cytosolic endo-beta-N-acetylglucosaminidase 1 [Rhodamnia argentea]|uniref:mannosyl-glycoprotein endo-beta-N-acetylglucosaminidase n=1 Tax=Rhodamnia argentea TaxID=178133 RepID=A0A8B8Q013_9MYRT|nr:cytosolic endo-beta-N-acetylglucosaminidase 1 [Rhodamnia argentea]
MFPLHLLLNFLSTIVQRIKIFAFSLIMSENLKNHEEQEEPLSPRQDPDPFNPVSPSTPISYPIKTLEELESRSYFESFHYLYNRATVSLQTKQGDLPNRPRILVCHDMQGGYLDDKWVQGGDNAEAYAIWHWYLMDVFVYFSHNLVTLPPPCWTNAAHRHGVRVLGTFIAEWEEGRLACNKLLSTKDSARMYAERLAQLAAALGFDGWLINMEVDLKLEQIPIMLEFVSHLTQTMHSSVPGSLVIWYDSVTIHGHLKWQDQLNNYNKPFFDLCDGIFVNYTWRENYPRLSAAVAGDRKYDVYMGIDVFGRNTYGGGQWKASVALDVLKKDEVSAAIFAPGWVYETKQPPNFETAQNHWWSLVENSWGVLQRYPKSLPFHSNFDQGRGYHYSVDGNQISEASWCNISCQSFQPFLEFHGDGTDNPIVVSVNLKEASFSGGGNITFKGTLKGNAYFTARLFEADLPLGNSPMYFTYSVKSEGSSLVGLSLEFSSEKNERNTVLLASHGNALDTMNQFVRRFSEVIMPRRVTKLESSPEWVILESSISMDGYTLKGIRALCYRPLSTTSGSGDRSVEFYAVLGHITIKTEERNSFLPPSSSWLVEGRDIKWASDSHGSKTVSLKITWEWRDGNSPYFSYNVYVEEIIKMEGTGQDELMSKGARKYLGAAQVRSFYVSDHVVQLSVTSLKFIIQVCTLDGACQKLDESPRFALNS